MDILTVRYLANQNYQTYFACSSLMQNFTSQKSSLMDFIDTAGIIKHADTPISDQDLLHLRSQIFEAVYRKPDLIRANYGLSHERDELRRRNRELEGRILEESKIREEKKRDLEVSRVKVGELEGETKDKSRLVLKTAESLRLSIRFLNKENNNVPETEENNPESIMELVKEVETKVETFVKSMEKKTIELSRNVELLEDENRDINDLLRAALSEKQTAEKLLKETNEQKRSALLQIAERGLQSLGFGFGFRESETENLAKDEEEEEEEEENGLVIAIEKTMKNLRKEVSQLKISLEESRLEEERLKKFTEEQAHKLEENAMYIDKLQNRQISLTQNGEELVKVIREAESEVSRWREACELEVEAGKREVEVRDQLITVLKAEIEKMRSALVISQGKLKLKEELAKAAMAAEEAAEKSIRLAERRITELLSRIEHLYHQLEEAESTERKRGKFRYLWCWPLWRFPTAASAAIDSSSYVSNRALLRYGSQDLCKQNITIKTQY